MDQITVARLVQDRTQDLQRTADQVRQERSLRSTARAAAATSASARPAEARPQAAARLGGCAPAEPAVGR